MGKKRLVSCGRTRREGGPHVPAWTISLGHIMKLCFALLILALVKGSVADVKCRQPAASTNVKSFWKKLVKISMPCKYNAVRQKCGKYFINVTPGLITHGNKFRLNTMWVGVKNESKGGTQLWEGRTSNKKAVKFLNGNTTEFLSKKGGNTATSAMFNFSTVMEDDVKVATAVEVNGVFTVTFTPWDPDSDDYKKSWWTFTCHAADCEIAPYPQQVCGGDKDSGFKYGNFVNDFGLTAEQMFLYNVFAETDTDITQVNDQCQKAEDLFQNMCQDNATRKDAIITCGQILTVKNRRKCVTKYSCSPMDVFVDCLEWACGGYTNDTLCDNVASSTDFCKKASFPDGNLTGKIEAANCYKDYIPIIH